MPASPLPTNRVICATRIGTALALAGLVQATELVAQEPVAPLSATSAGSTGQTSAVPSVSPGLPLPSAARLNPTGRDIALVGPLRIDDQVVGEVDFILGADDSLRVNGVRLIEALRRILKPAALVDLQARIADLGFVPAARLDALGYRVGYDAETVGLVLAVPPALRPSQALGLSRRGALPVGEFDAPAAFTGYINFRNYLSYDWGGVNRGVVGPASFINSAFRFKGVVLENLALLDASSATVFRRESTRFVYDDRQRLVRWSLGDLQPISRGFSGAPEIAGLGISRIYSQLDPLLLVQPRGNRSFTLARASTVQAVINGQAVRRFRLQPGSYNLNDFPFAQGGNDVQLQIRDDAGVQQVVAFSIFFDRSLLAPGRTEFGLYAGIRSPQSGASRDYRFDAPAASGFARRGITDALTAGLNFNLQQDGGIVGGEIVWANPLGTIGLNAAVSQVEDAGFGYAFNASYTTILRRTGTSLGFAVERVSTGFAYPGDFVALNRFAWDVSTTLSQRLTSSQSISITARRAFGRDAFVDETNIRAQYGWQMNNRLYLTAEALYQDGAFARHDYSGRLRLTIRLSPRSSAYAQFEAYNNRGQVGVETTRGSGVGALSLSAAADVGKDALGVDASVNYLANRADIGLDHTTSFDLDGTSIDSQRTTLRVGTALVFADGRFGVSRPIFDSFVMAAPHRTLKDARVYLEPSRRRYEARSGLFGAAVEPNLSSYIPRIVTYDVPDAPAGYDLGTGTLRAFPPYRSGYLIVAGSDYSVTAVGVLLGTDGKPVSLLAGSATERARPERPSVTVFTNQTGRFGISALRPGRWTIEMPTQPPTSVEIEVPAGTAGVLRLGAVKLGERQ